MVVIDRRLLVVAFWVGNSDRQMTFASVSGVNREFDGNGSRNALFFMIEKKNSKIDGLPDY